MAKNEVYNTTSTQVLITPNKNGGNFLDELNELIPHRKDVDAYAPHNRLKHDLIHKKREFLVTNSVFVHTTGKNGRSYTKF